LFAAGITQRRVAEESGTTVPHVCNVFAGRIVSANVVSTAERLLARATWQGQETAIKADLAAALLVHGPRAAITRAITPAPPKRQGG
jgi:hypothetical protein